MPEKTENSSTDVALWEAHGRTIIDRGSEASWQIAEWVHVGISAHGLTAASISAGFGLARSVCHRYGNVASMFPRASRHAGLSFSHHLEVAGLDAGTADDLLREAAESGLSSRELRKRAMAFADGARLKDLEKENRLLRKRLKQANERLADETVERITGAVAESLKSTSRGYRQALKSIGELAGSGLLDYVHGNRPLGCGPQPGEPRQLGWPQERSCDPGDRRRNRCAAQGGRLMGFRPASLTLSTAEGMTFQAATDPQRAKAARRLEVCDRSDALHRGGRARDTADGIAATEYGVSIQSIRRWRGLIVSRSASQSRIEALLDRPGRGRPQRSWTEGEESLFELYRTDYLRAESPDASACYRRLIPIAEKRGIDLPPKSAFMTRLNRETSHSRLTRARSGAMALLEASPAQERSVVDLGPLEIVNGDGRRHDIIVEFPSGRIGRPCVWAWQDVWSRKILAWRAGETESADLVRTSLHELIMAHGVPGRLLTDSTRAVSAKWLTGGQKNRKRWRSSDEELPGLLKILDIQFSATKVDTDSAGRGRGRGRAKPVERAFADLARQIDTHPNLAGAYTGRSVEDRPETHRSRPASWEVFLSTVADCVIEHNSRQGRRTEIAAGRSFDDAWCEGIAQAVIRRISPGQASILLLAAEDARVGRDGAFRLKTGRAAGLPANRYHSRELLEHVGQRVVARFDPENLHADIQVYDVDGRWLCSAQCLMPVGFSDAGAAGEYERARRQHRRATEMGLKAVTDMDALVQALDDADRPVEQDDSKPAAIRLVTDAGVETPKRTVHRTRKSAAVSAAVKLYRED